jgi:UDP-N-acetylglucosamine 2-epimerase (non-hydrolysing)
MTQGARLLYVVSDRLSAAAIAPVHAELRQRVPAARHALLHANGNTAAQGPGGELRLPDPDYFLDVKSESPVSQTTMAMEQVERVIEVERPDLILLADDSASTLSAALTALKLHIPTARLDAGLRSFDRHMPEEINRVIMDAFADLLFTSCDRATANLQAEGTAPERMHLVGSTSADTLIELQGRLSAASTALRLGLDEGAYLLVVLSEATLANPRRLGSLLGQLGQLSAEMPVIMPAPFEPTSWASHPRRSGVRIVEPLDYLDLLSLQSTAATVITDSGLVQDETALMGVPCLTMRAKTERVSSIERGTNVVVGDQAPAIARIREAIESAGTPAAASLPPLWDGRASARVAEVIEAKLPQLEKARPPVSDLSAAFSFSANIATGPEPVR